MDEDIDFTIASAGIFDEERVYPNCTVQVWRNSVTGEESWGWFENPKKITDEELDDIIEEVKGWD